MAEQMTERDTNEPSTARRVLHSLVQVAVALVALAAVGGAWWLLHHFGEPGEVNAAPVPAGPPPEVAVIELEAQPVPVVNVHLGQTQAAQTVEIRARVEGFLEARHFEEGTLVEPGQLLFEIDPQPFEAEVAVAAARLASARATAEFEAQQMARLQELYEQEAATTPELEEQQSRLDVAQANVALEEARLRQAQIQLGYTSIESPIRGLIGQSLQDVGTYVNPAEGLLAVVEQVDPIDVTFTVSEQQWLRLTRQIEEGILVGPGPGEVETRIVLADGTVYPYHGLIDFISTDIDPSTSTALLRARVPNPQGTLRPGQFVRVSPLGFVRQGAVVVPQAAVQQLPTGASVYVLNESNEAIVRPIELGEWVDTGWIIQAGLEPGDRVIVNGLQMVRPGRPVEPVLADPARFIAPGPSADRPVGERPEGASSSTQGVDAPAETDADVDVDVDHPAAPE